MSPAEPTMILGQSQQSAATMSTVNQEPKQRQVWRAIFSKVSSSHTQQQDRTWRKQRREWSEAVFLLDGRSQFPDSMGFYMWSDRYQKAPVTSCISVPDSSLWLCWFWKAFSELPHIHLSIFLKDSLVSPRVFSFFLLTVHLHSQHGTEPELGPPASSFLYSCCSWEGMTRRISIILLQLNPVLLSQANLCNLSFI